MILLPHTQRLIKMNTQKLSPFPPVVLIVLERMIADARSGDRVFLQAQPDYKPFLDENKCCFGAHLAHILGVEKSPGGLFHFEDGIDEFCRLCKATPAQVVLMLRSAGAGDRPLCGIRWNTEPAVVMERLCEIEELPATSGHDFNGCSFGSMNCTGTDFTKCCVMDVSFTSADCTDAKFVSAMVGGTSFVGADLTRADFSGAVDLEHAYFFDAKLDNTIFPDGFDPLKNDPDAASSEDYS